MELNDGPLHDHPVFTWVPSLLVPNKLRGNPEHTGALLEASASGKGLIVTETVLVMLHGEFPLSVIVTVYVPEAPPDTVGFCAVELGVNVPVPLH